MSGTLIIPAYEAWLAMCEQTLTDFLVLDGPQPTYTSEKDLFVVGCDDLTATGRVRAIDSNAQNWASLGAYSREETFSIFSTLGVWTGDNDLPTCRATADTAIQALTQALYPAPHGAGDAMLNNTLNQNGVGTGWCGLVSVGPMYQEQTQAGPLLTVGLVLGCFARI